MTHTIDFSREWISEFWDEFSVVMRNHALTPNMQRLLYEKLLFSDEAGYLDEWSLEIAELHVKPGLWLENIEWWEDTEDRVGVHSFETSTRTHCALRLDMIRSSFAKFGRRNLPIHHLPNFLPHAYIPYAKEAKKRWSQIENPLGFISISDKKGGYLFLVIVEVVTGWSRMPDDISEDVAVAMAQILSTAHSHGVIHHHPHANNWILVNDAPKLVDGKGLLVAEDFPHKTCTNRITTFDMFRESDKQHVLQDFFFGKLEKEEKAFQNTYDSLYTPPS